MKEPTLVRLETGETVLTLPLEGTERDGSPRQVVVTLPPGQKLDTMTIYEIVEILKRVASRRRGSA